MEEIVIAVVSAIVGSIASEAIDLVVEAAEKRKTPEQHGKHTRRS